MVHQQFGHQCMEITSLSQTLPPQYTIIILKLLQARQLFTKLFGVAKVGIVAQQKINTCFEAGFNPNNRGQTLRFPRILPCARTSTHSLFC